MCSPEPWPAHAQRGGKWAGPRGRCAHRARTAFGAVEGGQSQELMPTWEASVCSWGLGPTEEGLLPQELAVLPPCDSPVAAQEVDTAGCLRAERRGPAMAGCRGREKERR